MPTQRASIPRSSAVTRPRALNRYENDIGACVRHGPCSSFTLHADRIGSPARWLSDQIPSRTRSTRRPSTRETFLKHTLKWDRVVRAHSLRCWVGCIQPATARRRVDLRASDGVRALELASDPTTQPQARVVTAKRARRPTTSDRRRRQNVVRAGERRAPRAVFVVNRGRKQCSRISHAALPQEWLRGAWPQG